MSNKTAIVSVYDKSGLDPFVRGLVERGVSILSTGGTAHFLQEAKIQVQSISDYTGSPEILEGRVKSLHPKIHGGILARRDNADDMADLEKQGIPPIDFVIVNLYPFTRKVNEILAAKDVDHGSLVELIDIGGPTMIRAAAKNFAHVAVVSDPSDYQVVLDELDAHGEVALATRRQLAAKVFVTMAAYDAQVARYFSLDEKIFDENGLPIELAPYEAIVLAKQQDMRYGENPHQHAAYYRAVDVGSNASPQLWSVLQGKELSYNNLVDMQGTLDLFLDLYQPGAATRVAVVVKHTNPCGAAIRSTPLEAFKAARACDPVSAFGGIIAVSGVLDEELAKCVLEGFVELLLASEITDGAKAVLKKKKNIRLIQCDFDRMQEASVQGWMTFKNSCGGFLGQSSDSKLLELEQARLICGPAVAPAMMDDLNFAWAVCKHVKSNAIVVAKDLTAIGIGAGQMNRVDSARLALSRAGSLGHAVEGAVAASDAFLPFPDTLEVLNDAGILALVQPGGSMRDEAVIELAKERGVTMLFTGDRHFKH